MVALLYLVSALILGAAIVRRLDMRLYVIEYAGLSVALGLLGWTWLSFLAALILPYDWSLPLSFAVAGGLSLLLWNHSPTSPRRQFPRDAASRLIWGGFTLISTTILAWLFWTHDLISTASGIYAAGSTWADFGVHASLISHFAAATRLPLDMPLAAGTHLTYPFLIDLLSAWLVRGGWSIHLAIVVPSLLLTVAFLQLMIGFGIRLFGRVGGVVLGLTVALLDGSAVGLTVAWSDWQQSGLGLWAWLGHIPHDYTALEASNAHLTNLVTDIILPQRSFLFGLAAFGAVMVLLAEAEATKRRLLPYVAAIIVGLLPLAHPHTFVTLGFVLVAFAVRDVLQHKSLRSDYLTAGAIAVMIALPQLVWQQVANHNGSGGHSAWGWMVQPNEALFTFWAHNYGLMGLWIVALGVAIVTVPRWRRYIVWFAPFVAVFALANIYSLQPFAYDNLKLINYAYLMAAIFGGAAIAAVIRQRRLAIIPLGLLIIIITLPGLLAVTREFQLHDQFASNDDLDLVAWVSSETKVNDVFITTDRPNQPVATLTGRPIILGYRGWLFNFNIDYHDRENTVADALSGLLTPNETARYHAKYLLVATYEPSDWPVDRAALARRYQPVYANPSWTLYRLP